MGHDTTIPIAIRCQTGSPRNTRQIQIHRNPPPRCGVLLFFRLCLCTHLGFSSVGSLPSSFCCPSHGHIIGLTVQPANSNLVPLGLGLLPEHVRLFFVSFFIFIFFSFVIFYFFPCLVSFLIPGTWYSLVVARYLIYYCCKKSVSYTHLTLPTILLV